MLVVVKGIDRILVYLVEANRAAFKLRIWILVVTGSWQYCHCQQGKREEKAEKLVHTASLARWERKIR